MELGEAFVLVIFQCVFYDIVYVSINCSSGYLKKCTHCQWVCMKFENIIQSNAVYKMYLFKVTEAKF